MTTPSDTEHRQPQLAGTPWSGLGRRAYNRDSDEPPERQATRGCKGHTSGQRSKAQTLRDLIRKNGRLNARQLAKMAELEATALVGALLKNDVAIGRIKFDGVAYCWHEGFDETLQRALTDAVALLRRHGYRVEKP
jgi:hypothetical protein